MAIRVRTRVRKVARPMRRRRVSGRPVARSIELRATRDAFVAMFPMGRIAAAKELDRRMRGDTEACI